MINKDKAMWIKGGKTLGILIPIVIVIEFLPSSLKEVIYGMAFGWLLADIIWKRLK
jgi:hypothetical protein